MLNRRDRPPYSNLREQPVIHRLIATWCFAEAGLGGLMHALHIPLTGFLIGGLAVLINTFLALHSRNNASLMLSALGTVLLVKFALSPQSPVGAYVAVGFQGTLAIAVYRSFGVNRTSILFYSLFVMLENAVQKPLMAALIFGKELWDGLLLFARDFLHLGNNAALSLYLVLGLYLLLYLVWGWLLATWTWSFIRRLPEMNPTTWSPSPLPAEENSPSSGSKGRITLAVLFISSFLLLAIWKMDPGLSYFLRVAALLLLIGFVVPLAVRWVFRRLLRQRASRVLAIQEEFPQIRRNFRQAWRHAQQEKGWRKLRQFLFLSVYFNIFRDVQAAAPHR